MKNVHLRIREGVRIYHGPVGNYTDGPNVIVLSATEAAEQIDAGNVDLVNAKDIEALKIPVSKPDSALEEMEKQMNFYKALSENKKSSRSVEEENKHLKTRMSDLESKLLDLMEKHEELTQKLENAYNEPDEEDPEDFEEDPILNEDESVNPEGLTKLELLKSDKKNKKAGG
jgi:chromosome segregation ATPase